MSWGFVTWLAASLWAVDIRAESDHEEDETPQEPFVIVTAEPPLRDSASMASIDRAAIDAAGVKSAQDLLRTMLGIQLSQHGSEGKAGQFYMRGFDAAHGTDVTVTADGLTLNEPSHIHGHGYADSGVLIPEALRGVDVKKGAFSLDQGNLSTAGQVEFRLGVPEPWRGTAAGFEAGWPHRGRLWAYHAGETRPETDVVAAEVVGGKGAFENRHTARAGLIGQHTLGPWRIRGAVQVADFGLPGATPLEAIEDGFIERGDSLTPETSGRTGQGWIGAVYESEGDGWNHRTSFDVRSRQYAGRENFTGYLMDETRGDERLEFQRGISGTADHRSKRPLTDNWSIVGYAGAAVGRFRQYEDAVDDQGRVYRRERGGVGWQANAYVAPGIEGFVTDNIEVEGGVRLEALGFDYREDEDIGGEQGREVVVAAVPRLSGRWFFLPSWILTAGLGSGYRGPEARVFAGEMDVPADEDLREHRGGRPRVTYVDSAELGIVFEATPSLELATTVFGYQSEAEYIYDHVSRLQVDQGPTRRMGWEWTATVQLAEAIRLRAHGMVVDARFRENGDEIPGAPALQGGVTGFGQWSNGWFGGVEWRGVGRRPLSFGASAAPWQLTNAHLGWERDGWTLRLDIENVFDNSWDEGVYHYASHFDVERRRSAIPELHVVAGHPRVMRAKIEYRW